MPNPSALVLPSRHGGASSPSEPFSPPVRLARSARPTSGPSHKPLAPFRCIFPSPPSAGRDALPRVRSGNAWWNDGLRPHDFLYRSGRGNRTNRCWFSSKRSVGSGAPPVETVHNPEMHPPVPEPRIRGCGNGDGGGMERTARKAGRSVSVCVMTWRSLPQRGSDGNPGAFARGGGSAPITRAAAPGGACIPTWRVPCGRWPSTDCQGPPRSASRPDAATGATRRWRGR